MAWTRTIVAVCAFCACSTTADKINGDLPAKFDNETETFDGICLTPECVKAASWILSNQNSDVDPCDNFYEFACGNRRSIEAIANHCAEDERISSDRELQMHLRKIIGEIDVGTAPKHFRLIKYSYDNCMNEVDNDDYYPASKHDSIVEGFRGIDGWPVLAANSWNENSFNVLNILQDCLMFDRRPDMGNRTYFATYVEFHKRGYDSNNLALGFDNEVVQAYYEFMVDIAVLMGAVRAGAMKEIKESLLFEMALANCTIPRPSTFLAPGFWERTTVGEFIAKYPKLPLREVIYSWAQAEDNAIDNDVIIANGYFKKLENLLSNTSKKVMANWLMWTGVIPHLGMLSPETRARMSRFVSFSGNTNEKRSKWRECVDRVRETLPFALGALYQRKYPSPDIIRDHNAMMENMKQEFSNILRQASWIDPKTKQEALLKIENTIGYILNYDKYTDDLELKKFYDKYSLVDGVVIDESQNTPVTDDDARAVFRDFLLPNSVYFQHLNIFQIGAPFTMRNFYHIDRPKYLNYGAIGTQVGHEMSHSLDLNGIFFDKNATFRDWWVPETKEKFLQRVQCLVEQYGNYTVDEVNTKLNGERLSSENIADNNGVRLAYFGYRRWMIKNEKEKELPGLPYTPQQMFWIAAANAKCAAYTRPILRQYVGMFEYAVPKYRINGALANSPEFAKDFKCKCGSQMNPVKKCQIF